MTTLTDQRASSEQNALQVWPVRGGGARRLHDLVLGLYLFCLPINHRYTSLFFASGVAKIGLFGLLVAVCGLSLLANPRERRTLAVPKRVVLLAAGYIVWIGLMTFVRLDLPTDRYRLYVFFAASLPVFLIVESRRPGTYFRVLLTVAVLHLIFAVLLNHHLSSNGGISRLSGGSHPLTLGFESAVVLSWCFVRVLRRTKLHITVPLGALATYTLIATYSRTALVSTIIAAVLAIVLAGRGSRVVRVLSSALPVCVAAYLLAQPFVSYLARKDARSLSTATGRTDIWRGVLSQFGTFSQQGFGYGALRDGRGPDHVVWVITHGEPTEMAFLSALLMGGVVGLAIWVAYFLTSMGYVVTAAQELRPFAAGLALIIAIQSTFNEGTAGMGIEWYWVLAAVSLASVSRPAGARVIESTPATARPIAGPRRAESAVR